MGYKGDAPRKSVITRGTAACIIVSVVCCCIYIVAQFESSQKVFLNIGKLTGLGKTINYSCTSSQISSSMSYLIPNRTDQNASSSTTASFASSPVLSASHRVVCMIFVRPRDWPRKGTAVKNTWARHCHRRFYFYSKPVGNDTNFMKNVVEGVPLPVPEGREHLTAKTFTALYYSHKIASNDSDWYIKADDDSYIIWRNLIRYLSRFRPHSESLYFGHRIEHTMGHVPNGYNSGGGVYVISALAVNRMAIEGVANYSQCYPVKAVGGWEDVAMGDCLQKLSVYPSDTRLEGKILRFHGIGPMGFFRGVTGESGDHTLEQYYYYERYSDGFTLGVKNEKKENIFSKETISFHYMPPSLIYFVDTVIDMLL